MNWTEDELIRKLQSGNSDAIEFMYRQEFQKVRAFVKNNSGNLEDARDLFQESIVELIANLLEGKFMKKSKVSTYLFSIAKFKWLGKLKEKGRSAERSLVLSENQMKELRLKEEGKREKMAIEEDEKAIMSLVKELSEECQKLLKGFYFYKKSMKELADILNYSDAFVRVKKNRCMNELREKAVHHPLLQKRYHYAIDK